MTEDRDAPQKSRRHKAEAGLEFAESALFEEMEHAAKLLKSEEDFGRSGVSHAVYACYSFLHVRGLTGYALKPLADLVRAFQSVDEGVLPELFDPNIKSGELPYRKWSRSWAATETKIYAAACMDALMETGSSKDEAAKRVARATDSWPRISTGLLQQNRQGQEWLLFSGLSKYFSVDPNARKRLKKVLEEGPTLMSGVRKERK
jgi:hypothetical protein